MKTEIIKLCAELFDVSVSDIMSRRRMSPIIEARFALYAALRQRGWSYLRIGMFFGRDHTTILHGVRQAECMKKYHRSYAEKVEELATWKPKPVEAPVEEIVA